MKLIWHGTASIELRGNEGTLLFDPFVPLKGSSWKGSIEAFDGFSNLFVTHGHMDHIRDIPEIVKRNPRMTVYCTKTPYYTLRKKGVPNSSLRVIKPGDTVKVNGFTLKVYPGKHAVLPKLSAGRVSRMLGSKNRRNIPSLLSSHLTCPENGETVFYQIEHEGKKISLIGSLNLAKGNEYPTESDLLLLPYNGWADNFPPAESAMERLKPKRVILHHFDDTFPPFTEPLDLTPILKAYPGIVEVIEEGTVVTV